MTTALIWLHDEDRAVITFAPPAVPPRGLLAREDIDRSPDPESFVLTLRDDVPEHVREIAQVLDQEHGIDSWSYRPAESGQANSSPTFARVYEGDPPGPTNSIFWLAVARDEASPAWGHALGSPADLEAVFEALSAAGAQPRRVLHSWPDGQEYLSSILMVFPGGVGELQVAQDALEESGLVSTVRVLEA